MVSQNEHLATVNVFCDIKLRLFFHRNEIINCELCLLSFFLDGHPEDDSWGKLNPAQAAEHQQNDYRQQRFGQPTNPYGPNQYGQPNNQFGPPNNPYGPAYPQYGAPQNQYGTQGQYGAQNQYPQQPGGYGYAGYNGGLPQGRGKKGRKNGGQGFGPPMQPPMQQPYGQGE